MDAMMPYLLLRFVLKVIKYILFDLFYYLFKFDIIVEISCMTNPHGTGGKVQFLRFLQNLV